MRFFAILAVVLLALASFGFKERAQAPVVSEGYSLERIEIASSSAARQHGLSGRTDVPQEYGLLFVFEEKGDYGFWMKDMKVSIDMLWLADDGTILGITDNVSPDTYPQAFHPPAPVRYVLETRAGEAARKGWGVGTKLSLPL